MKKNFVKYFGVASTTLLAVAPVATPALMTASNLAVVKAGVQDDISAAFKADNSLVQLTADQWKGLTSTVVNDKPDTNTIKASQQYLDALKAAARDARTVTARNVRDFILANLDKSGSSIEANHRVNEATGKYDKTYITATLFPLSGITTPINTVYEGNGRNHGTIKETTNTRFDQFLSVFSQLNNTDGTNNPNDAEKNYDKQLTYDNIFTDIPNDGMSKAEIAKKVGDYIANLPLWWFVSEQSNSFQAALSGSGIFNSRSKIFTTLPGAPTTSLNNGLVTVAPNGGVSPSVDDYNEDDPSLAYVGDNLVYLQKATNNELLNLIPAVNKGKNKAGTKFSSVQGKFRVPGGTVTADANVSDGSKVWSTILQSVLNPNNAMYPLKDLTTSNITKTKMLVNGKDADKNQFITKDEIQNADRISIQFIFKDNAGNEYKSPTIWLTHGNKFTVNTSGLGNITRLPGDYYQPSAGITGIYNDTGLPMDTKKFVVIPAGTDLAYYTDTDGNIDLARLAELQGGILGTNGVAVDRNWTTAFEGGQLDASQFWTRPNYIYSKFGSYSDAVDVYYIDGNIATGNSTQVTTKSRVENRTEAAAAVAKVLKSEIIDNKNLAYDTEVDNSNLWNVVDNAVKPYLDDTTTTSTPITSIKGIEFGLGIDGSTKLDTLFPAGGTKKAFQLRNNEINPSNQQHVANAFDTHYKDISVDQLFNDAINRMDAKYFKETKATVNGSSATVPASQFVKLAANAGRTTKIDVPSKYLPQVSFNDYSNKGATYYANGSTIDNWFNYSWKADSAAAPSNNDPYYPAGGVIVTGGSSTSGSSSAAKEKEPVGYLAPASFAANSINADQLQARVNDNIQKYLTAKLTNPNTQNDSKVNGYFKGYSSGDAAYAYIKNGAVPASDLKIDTSKVDVTKPGTYYVEVTYAPLSSIKSNTVDGALGATNGNVAITDANGNIFENGSLTSKPFIDYSNGNVSATASTSTTTAGASSSLTSFAADQIFANGAPATYKLKVQITAGSSVPEYGAPVIAFTEGGQNLKIPKGGTFDQFKGLQFYAYPGAKAWDQKDDSVKVSVSGKVNTNVEGTYTLVYTVTNKAGKTSTLTRVITVGSGVEKPTEYDFNLSEAYIDYVPGYNVREYSYPGNDWTGNQVKHGTDVKVTKRAVFQNGEEWYKLGDGNWVKSQYVKAGKNPGNAVDARGVVTVNYIPGYGIAVYKEAGKPELVKVNGKAKRLPHGTAWKSFKKQKVNGITYYNVGGNQWVDGRYVDFK